MQALGSFVNMPMNLHSQLSIVELGQMLRNGPLQCEELTRAVLLDIEARNPHLGAFVRTTDERAIIEARRAQHELDSGLDLGPLHGIPYAVKDLFNIEGQINSAGTPLLDEHIAQTDATVIKRLTQAGAVLVGQTHTSPLAATILGINHARGTPHNPWKEEAYLPGGSSSGSAVAVAAGLVPFTLGTDTGGSVRVPAALCGVVGLKPTVGSIDMEGVWPLAPSLDSIGSFTRSVQDAACVYATLQDMPIISTDDIEGLRIGICENIFFDDAQSEVEAAVQKSARVLENLGAELVPVTLAEVNNLYALACETSLIASEGYPLHKELIENPQSDWVVHWLKVAKDYPENQLEQARKQQAELALKLTHLTQSLNALLVPTTPIVAPRLSSCESPESHSAMSALLSRNTLIGNLAGWCGLSLPCAINKNGLPVGLMIYAAARNEMVAIRIARAFESASDWAVNNIIPPFSYRASL